MLSDDAGRDVRDRLHWQKELHNQLSGIVPIPKIIDMFRIGDDDYLVMEYIKGKSLYFLINALNYKGDSWPYLSVKLRTIILGFIIQLIEITAKLHDEDIIDRDITPVNFIVNKKQKLILIDIELAYSLKKKKPHPPFQYGTHGFMSPEQCLVKTPTKKEDIFALGATIITLLTGLPPGTFNGPRKRLIDNLNFFIHDIEISHLVSDCFSIDPGERPPVEVLKNAFLSYKVAPKRAYKSNIIDLVVAQTINSGIKGVGRGANSP